MPETRDSEWDWDVFVRRNNDELVATWDNLANRVLSFAHKNWEGVVPAPGELRDRDREILAEVDKGFETVGSNLEAVRLRAALSEAMRLAGEVNRYLDQAAPWFEIKTDKATAGTSIFTALRAIDSLKVLFSPFLPFTCERLHTYLGYEAPLYGHQSVEEVEDDLGVHSVLRYHPETGTGAWEPSQLPAGQAIQKPKPLFQKLDPEIADEERARLPR